MRLALSFRVSVFATAALVPVACGGTEGDARPKCTDPSMYSPGLPIFCKEGYFYRGESAICSRVNPATASRPRVSGSVDCSGDPGVCLAYAYGVCVGMGGGSEAHCVSGCGTDADCGDGERCDCNGNGGNGECRHDDCYSDAECEPGFHCAATTPSCGVFSCQTPKDRCFGSSDCPAGQYCVVQDGVRQCSVSDGCN
jgi:Dickkopf N-terminal cysteine-rich region